MIRQRANIIKHQKQRSGRQSEQLTATRTTTVAMGIHELAGHVETLLLALQPRCRNFMRVLLRVSCSVWLSKTLEESLIQTLEVSGRRLSEAN